MKATKVILATILLISTGCKPRVRDSQAEGFGTGRVSLKGTYGIRRGAEVEPIIKVEETKDGGYTFEERRSDQWLAEPETPHTSTDADLLQSFHGPVRAAAYGLSTSKLAIYIQTRHLQSSRRLVERLVPNQVPAISSLRTPAWRG